MPGNPYSYVAAFPKDFQIVDGLGRLMPAWQYFFQALWAKTGGGNTSIQNTYIVIETPAGPVIAGPGPSNGTPVSGLSDAPVDGKLYGRQSAAWHLALSVTGGTLTGPLILSGDPTFPLGAATKEYVDSVVVVPSGFLPLTGGTLTGDLGLPTSHFVIPATVVASGATTINRTNGEYQRVSLTTNSTIAVTGWPAAGSWGRLVLEIDNTGAFGISGWPTGTVWPGGIVPTITSGSGSKDVVVLMSGDGGVTVFGNVAGQNYH